MIFKKAFQKNSDKKQEEKHKTQTEAKDFKIVDNPKQIYVETFEDLLSGATEEIKNDFRSQMKTVQPQRKVFTSSNRRGMTIDQNFLEDVLSQRHQDLQGDSDEAEGDAMFNNPVYRTQVDSMVSMEDFHDKFFGRQTQNNQSVDAIYLEQKQTKKSVGSDHSFEVVDYDSEINSNPKAVNQQLLGINVNVQINQPSKPVQLKDTSPKNSTEELLQQPTSIVNDTTTPSESPQSSSELPQQTTHQSLAIEPENRPTADFSQLQQEFQVSAEEFKANILTITRSISQEDLLKSQKQQSKFSSSIDSRSSNSSPKNFNQIVGQFENRPTADFLELKNDPKLSPIITSDNLKQQKDDQLQISTQEDLSKDFQESNKFLEDAQIIAQTASQFEEPITYQDPIEISFPTPEINKSPKYSPSRESKTQNQDVDQSSIPFSQSIDSNFNQILTDSYFNRKRELEIQSEAFDPYELPLQKSSISIPVVPENSSQQNLESEDVTRQKIRKQKSNISLQKRNSLAFQQSRILTATNIAGRISYRPEVQLQNLQPIGDENLDESFQQDDFVDYTNLISRNREERKSAINLKDRKKSLLVKMTNKEYTMKEYNSSESNITDKSFEDGTSLNSADIERLLKVHDQVVAQDDDFLQDLMEFQNDPQFDQQVTEVEQTKEDEQEDFLKLLNQSESSSKSYAETKYKDLRKNNSANKSMLNSKKVVTDVEIMGGISRTFGQFEKKTCIFVQNEYILIGSSTGILYVYNKDTEQLVGTHKEDGKDFIDNYITCIDVHQLRSKYAVIGFQKGQLVVIDLTDIKKTVKLIKDHHKKPIVSVKFCDWIKEKPHFNLGQQHKCNECSDVKAWMFISVDTDGKVVQNTITNVYVGLYANDYVIVDPTRYYQSQPFEVLASRYVLAKYQNDIPDTSTIIAMANSESVVISLLGEKTSEQKFIADKPLRYPSENQGCVQPIISRLPCICWGNGKTPRFNFQTFPLLAIAWGPLIQIVVFKNINEGPIVKDDFQLDGYYIIAQSNSALQDDVDITIESLQFIDESILVAITSNQEIRMFNTEKFKDCEFIEPQYLQQLNMEEIDSRCKMLPSGTSLTQKQFEIELERETKLNQPIQQSNYGQYTAQTISVWEDKIVYISPSGVFKFQHLTWLDNLLQLNKKAQKNGQWIDVFSRALDIYTGKIKGLRIEGGNESQKRDKMRIQLKSFIESIIEQIINQIKVEKKLASSGVPTAQDFLSQNITKLIKLIIEFCIEIADSEFLFDTLQIKFSKEGLTEEFAEEIKQYVLAGTFSEIQIQEKIIEKGVIGPHKVRQSQIAQSQETINYAENVDKMMMNIRFEGCSKQYLSEQIQFCQKNNFSSAAMYLCQTCYQDQGPLHALSKLRDFYEDALTREQENNELRLQVDDVYELTNLPPTSSKRFEIENSSVYLGFKLLWAARRYLLGKKVPQGHFTNNQLHILFHDILDFITQEEMIELFLGIDAAAYFQIISIVFNNPSQQYTFVKSGRPQQKTTYHPLQTKNESSQQVSTTDERKPISMSHDLIVKRISAYFKKQDVQNYIGEFTEASPTRLRYLCFIASISGSYEKSEQDDTKLYYEVALELIRNSDTLIGFNKDLLSRRMTNKQMYRRLSKGGNTAPDDLKHLLLTEEMLLMLVERSKPILEDQKCLEQLLKAVDRTNFIDLKLVLYDLNHDYLKCLRLFMQHKEGRPKFSLVTNKGEIDGYDWLQEKFSKLTTVDNSFIRQQVQVFQREILSHALFLIKFNTVKTIMLCDTVFNSAHVQILEALQGEQQWQLVYIQQLIELKRDEIKQLVVYSGHNQTMKKTSGEVEKWKVILTMHVRLLCILEPNRVTKEIEKIGKENFYPIEDCLKICMDFKQIEACAILNKKLGNYSEAISQFLKVLQNELNFERFKKELYYFDKDQQKTFLKEQQIAFQENRNRLSSQINQLSDLNVVKLLVQSAVKSTVAVYRKEKIDDHYKAWVNRFGKNIELLDRILHRIQQILKNHAKDVIEVQGNDGWVQVLQALFKILFHPSLRKKSYCKRHLKQKIIDFCRSILQQISFKSLIQAASQSNKSLKYKAIRELVNEVFCDKTREIEMSLNLKNQSESDLLGFQKEADKHKATGYVFTEDSVECKICSKPVNEQKFKSQLVIKGSRSSKLDNILIFDCDKSFGGLKIQHAYHVRCLNKFMQEELSQNEVVKKEPLEDAALQKMFRCVTCYPKNQLILQSDDKRKTDNTEDLNSQTTDPANDFSQLRPSYRKTMALKPASAEQRLNQKKKLMQKFEETQMNNERLTLQDFNLNYQ